MKIKQSLFILSLLFFSITAFAEEYRRTISLEWEPIEGAALYDVEISKVLTEGKSAKPKVFASSKAEWEGKLELGQYTLRVRGRDRRKAPGEWSESQDFFVGLDTPKIRAPKAQDKILTNEEQTESVQFKWDPVNGADEYLFEINSEDGKYSDTKKLTDTELKLKLPVAAQYIWKVSAQNNKGFKSDSAAQEQFSHWGAKLNRPTPLEPTNGFVRELEWQRPNYGETFDFVISRYDEGSKKWEVKDKKLNFTDSKIPFSEKLPGGKYKLTIRANAKLRQSSTVTEMKFPVVNGKRTPAAEEIATVRESIDRTTGWFTVASYLITTITYEGNDSDQGTTSIFDNAVGGTGRFGLGYMSEKSHWGFLGIVDYSGFIVNSTIKNFGSLEANAIYRTNLGERSEIRQQIGGFFKELPVFIGNALSSNPDSAKLSAIGPHYGLEYWQAVSAKFGFQINSHLYMNAIKVSTPNGKEMSPDLSYQFGFLGSYRMTKKMTGLAGYAFRRDSVKYNSNSNSQNSSSITGNYLNLFLEWAL